MHVFYSFTFASWLHSQLQSKAVNRLNWLFHAHLHAVQSPLEEHLANSLHVLDTSAIVIQILAPTVVTMDPLTSYPKPSEDGIACFTLVLVVPIQLGTLLF